MNTKKRWIITAIVALALAAVIVAGIVLNHSTDRVLKATDGTETVAEGTEPAEETAEAQPVEETLEMVLPAGENTTSVSEAAAEQAVQENPDQPQADMASVSVSAEDTVVLPDIAGESAALEAAAGDNQTVMEPAAEEMVQNGETGEPAAPQEQTERVLITTDGEITAEGLQQNAAEPEKDETEKTEESEKSKEEPKEQEEEEETTEETGEAELHAAAADGAQIIVRKLDGTFPAGAYVKVFLVSPDSAQSAVQEALEADAELVDLIAYDITIYDKDGNEIVPDETIQVSIVGASLENGDAASVYHIEDSGVAKKVTDVEDSAQASFKPAGVVE